jgi:hypothetical protein
MLKRKRVNRTVYRTLNMARSDLFDYIERIPQSMGVIQMSGAGVFEDSCRLIRS